jgi:hypothetical protein
MSDINSSAVSLPAGSFEYEDLKKGLDKAAKGSAKNYDNAVTKALDESGAGAFEPVDPRNTPGYVLKEVENKELGITETIQVYDPKLGEKIEESGDVAIPPQAVTPATAPADGAASKE